jgi:transposase
MENTQLMNETGFSSVSGDGAPSPATSLHPRLAWIMCYEETKRVDEVCERFGISRKTFYKWLKRYKTSEGNSKSLIDQSRRPHTSPRATPQENVDLLLQAKRATGYGQRRLRAYMLEHHTIRLSERTIWKLLKKTTEEKAAA